jgi:amino-acid N-acetyltransferase
MELSFATDGDFEQIKQILEACGLDHQDIHASQLKRFIIAKSIDESALRGVVGLEPKGSVGLLRSLAVARAHRRQGLATRLVDKIEEYAREQGVAALYLLTLTAEDFFTTRGYQITDRDTAPSALQETTEFKSLCPETATCMKKHL